MKEIIAEIPREVIEIELSKERFIRTTNFGNNEIYIINCHNSPNTLKEIGRLREITFRGAGGGTGLDCDIDKFDTAEAPYEQLIVWNPEDKVLLGGYRFILGHKAPKDEKNDIALATSRLFNFSDEFISEYLPYSIELGRSFVQPKYQSTESAKKTIFALDNLWDGLGALANLNPEIKYFFGKVTMYPTFDSYARNLIIHFLRKYFPDNDNLVSPLTPLIIEDNAEELEANFTGNTYQENYKILSQKVREQGMNIPPLINSYMNLSPTMKTFGTSINTHFGNVEETGILITIDDIYDKKRKRYIEY